MTLSAAILFFWGVGVRWSVSSRKKYGTLLLEDWLMFFDRPLGSFLNFDASTIHRQSAANCVSVP